MVVVAIVGILGTTLSPILKSAQTAVGRFKATQGMVAMGMASSMYALDHDDTYMPAMNQREDGSFETWFGVVDTNRSVTLDGGYITPYLGGARISDPTAPTLDYLGDKTGFGYNWQTLGSDFFETGDFAEYPNCLRPAAVTSVGRPGDVLMFATSAYFHAPWSGGDGKVYDFGFVSPPRDWKGNPDIDFRHNGERKIDVEKKTVTFDGQAIVLMADLHAKMLKQAEVTDKLYSRGTPDGEVQVTDAIDVDHF